MGSSSVITVAAGMARNKITAITLGPEGVGRLGLLATALLVISTAFSLGLGQSGIRQVARANAQQDQTPDLTCPDLQRNALALVWATFLLGGFAAALVFTLREPLAGLVFGNTTATPLISWLSLASWASIAVAGLAGLVNGLHRFRLLALVNAWGAVLGSLIAVLAIRVWGQDGLGVMIAAPPTCTWLLAAITTRKLVPNLKMLTSDTVSSQKTHLVDTGRNTRVVVAQILMLWASLTPMVRLGAAVSTGLLISTATQFMVRIYLERTLGLAVAGQFQAAWNVTSVYIGFALGAIGAEYYPRISTVARDAERVNSTALEQLTLVLTLVLPIILAVITFAPEILHLLYAQDFGQASSLLRFLLSGDVAKVGVWVLGFLLLAREAKIRFFLTELIWNVVYAALIVISVEHFGLVATGWAYLVAYLVGLCVSLSFAWAETGFYLTREAVRLIFTAFALVLACAFASEYGGDIGRLFSGLTTLATGGWALLRLRVPYVRIPAQETS
jgi:PST family polysaccharide transporter